MDSLFRQTEPTQEEIASFHKDGCIIYPDIMSDVAREGLIAEMTGWEPARRFIGLSDEERQAEESPHSFLVRPWNDRGPWSDRLIDDCFVVALLRATIGMEYHFCHSAMVVATRGAGPGGWHQDHHHWKHENPVNLAERDKYYVQILYYPNGFKRGDRSLMAIPGSHRVAPTAEATPERLLAGDFDEEAGCKLEQRDLDLPPGSMVFINARMFHAFQPKPVDSPQPYRLFAIDIFKEAGPPHRYTQEIPPEWMENADSYRQMLFDREPYTEECWDQERV